VGPISIINYIFKKISLYFYLSKWNNWRW